MKTLFLLAVFSTTFIAMLVLLDGRQPASAPARSNSVRQPPPPPPPPPPAPTTLTCESGRIRVEWEGQRATARCDSRARHRAIIVREEWTCDPPGDMRGFCEGIPVEQDGERARPDDSGAR
jgi:hypothetical protein